MTGWTVMRVGVITTDIVGVIVVRIIIYILLIWAFTLYNERLQGLLF